MSLSKRGNLFHLIERVDQQYKQVIKTRRAVKMAI